MVNKTPKSKIPLLRFGEFNGFWEYNEIGNISEIIAGGTPSTTNNCYWMPKQIPWMSSGEINKKHLYSTDNQISEVGLKNSSSKWIQSNSVLIALAGQGRTRGTVAINHIPLTTNQSIAAIIPNNKLYFEFLYQNLESRYEELRANSSGDGSRGGLNKQIISAIAIILPNISEQTKIGNYFHKLDKLIVQKEKKHQKLKQFKKAMLNKMFPKNGSNTPEIRFNGFTDNWEEKRFSDIFNYDRPDLYIVKSTEYSDSNCTPVLTANKSFILGYTNENNTFNKPSIIFDDFTLDCKYVKFPYMVKSSAIKILTIKNKKTDDLEFAFNILFHTKIEILGHARHYIGVVQPTIIFVPNIEEQVKIGNYFKQLDMQINLQNKEIKKLKNIKKASLSKMFVYG